MAIQRSVLICGLLLLTTISCSTAGDSIENPVASASTANVTFSGGDGTSCDDAVVVVGAANEREGVKAEYEWIARKYPGFKRGGQGMGNCKFIADVIDITTASGEAKRVYFNISGFYGKL